MALWELNHNRTGLCSVQTKFFSFTQKIKIGNTPDIKSKSDAKNLYRHSSVTPSIRYPANFIHQDADDVGKNIFP